MHTAVWKVGGSLFDLPDLGPKLQRLFDEYSDCRVILVPGGGDAVDLVRAWQQCHGISDEAAHWLAIEAMQFNAQRLASLFPKGRIGYEWDELCECWRRGETAVFAMLDFAHHEEHLWKKPRFPHNWSVSSDTLAAWVAECRRADELLLLKSRALTTTLAVEDAAEQGYVDEFFPQLAVTVPRVCWCNLREAEPKILPWLSHGREETQG